jgi:hypothetical protein
MVKATVMSAATTANRGEHTPKENSVTPGQADVSPSSLDQGDFKVGIREATPGVSKAIRHNERSPARLAARVWSLARLDPAGGAGEASGPHPQ